MKKFLLLILSAGVVSPAVIFSQQRCATYEHFQKQLAENPAFARKVKDYENNYNDYMMKTDKPKGKGGKIKIPVVVHVVYNTAEQNISDAQVQSQIDVLNEDFTAGNNDYNNYDAGYGSVKGDANIEFCLEQVVRVFTKHKSFPVNDGMKFTKRGGSDAVDPLHKLNMWVCNLGQNLLGYAQFPGGPAETFGVVCHYLAFGRGATYNFFTNYNLGRTTTHEVGHCLGLRHIWGDTRCGNDLVDDTPEHDGPNFGCPPQGLQSLCAGNPAEMWMNFMDYTDDRCMYFFTDGQVDRANFFIENDEQINSIVNTACSSGPGQGNNHITAAGVNQSDDASMRKTGFEIYPTVTSGQLTLEINGSAAGMAEMNIYNLNAVLVMKQIIFVQRGSAATNINVSRLTNGIYFLQLTQGRVRSTRKFIVEH
jgi:hypothetical protein